VENPRGYHGARCGQGVGPRRARHARPEAGPARGCARLRSRRQAAPPLPSAVRRSRRVASGRGASRPIDARPPARVEQGLTRKGTDGTGVPSLMSLHSAWVRKPQGGPPEAIPAVQSVGFLVQGLGRASAAFSGAPAWRHTARGTSTTKSLPNCPVTRHITGSIACPGINQQGSARTTRAGMLRKLSRA